MTYMMLHSNPKLMQKIVHTASLSAHLRNKAGQAALYYISVVFPVSLVVTWLGLIMYIIEELILPASRHLG